MKKIPYFVENVKRLRKERGWSQANLADKMGVHTNHVNRMETGKYNPSLDTLIKLAETFEVPLDYLVYNKNDSLEEVRIEDQAFAEKIKLLNTIQEDDKNAIFRFIDAILTRDKMINFMKELEAK